MKLFAQWLKILIHFDLRCKTSECVLNVPMPISVCKRSGKCARALGQMQD